MGQTGDNICGRRTTFEKYVEYVNTYFVGRLNQMAIGNKYNCPSMMNQIVPFRLSIGLYT